MEQNPADPYAGFQALHNGCLRDCRRSIAHAISNTHIDRPLVRLFRVDHPSSGPRRPNEHRVGASWSSTVAFPAGKTVCGIHTACRVADVFISPDLSSWESLGLLLVPLNCQCLCYSSVVVICTSVLLPLLSDSFDQVKEISYVRSNEVNGLRQVYEFSTASTGRAMDDSYLV